MEEPIGKILKQIRESKGISLEEISQTTHIRISYLKAIEANDFESLPSEIQTRGFLRLYAQELGVEVDRLKVKDYHLNPNSNGQTQEIAEVIPTIESVKNRQFEITEGRVGSVKTDEGIASLETLGDFEAPEIPQFEFKPDTPDSNTIFEEIGRKLHQRRALISLSLEDVFENIHVRKSYLESLEAGRFDQMPSPVQARGMLANYAEFLNLDVDAVLLRFADGLQLQRLEKQNRLSTPKTSSKELSSSRLRLKNLFSLDLLVMIILFLSFAAFIIWGLNRILDVEPTDSEATELPEVADVLLATSTATPEATFDENQTDLPNALTPSGELLDTPLFTSVSSNFPINIVIIPKQQAWAQIFSDFSLVYEGRLLPGNAYEYSGDEIVEIITGNAGALEVFFNDQDIGSAGLIGQVEILTFTENGLVGPTPTITPTPTLEQTPTPTESGNTDITRTATNDETN